jgi:hypothetical protein
MPITVPQSDFSHPTQYAQIPGIQNPLGYQQIPLAGAATTLTVPNGAIYALIQASGGTITWRDDGIAPTSTTGMQIPSGAELEYNGALAKIQVYGASGTTANVSYYA